jgi:hypothetical protein
MQSFTRDVVNATAAHVFAIKSNIFVVSAGAAVALTVVFVLLASAGVTDTLACFSLALS